MSSATATRPAAQPTGKLANGDRKGEETLESSSQHSSRDEQPVTGISQKRLFVILNGKKTGDPHFREAVKHLR